MNLKQNIKKYAKKGVSSSRSFLKKQKDIKKDVVKNALANIYGTKGKQKRERISDKLKKLFDRKLRCPCCNKPFRHPEYHHLDCNPNNSNNASNILKVCSDCHKDIHSEISKQIRPLVKRIKIHRPETDIIERIGANTRKTWGYNPYKKTQTKKKPYNPFMQ